MKTLWWSVFFTMGLLLSTEIYSAEPGEDHFQQELNERDFVGLRDFLNTKREIDLKKKAIDLRLSGDVRFEYRHLTERLRGKNLRGKNAFKREIPVSKNDFDVEFNLKLDYDADNTWASVQVQYDNSAGVEDNGIDCAIDPFGFHGSGVCDDMCLKKAFFGYEIYECGDTEFYIELGRRNLYNVFDSRIQFLSRYDGVYLRYQTKWDRIGLSYLSFGAFVVDEKVNHYAWITEMGLLNVYDSGIDIKYSLIDWQKRGHNRCQSLKCRKAREKGGSLVGTPFTTECLVRNPNGFRFINSQFTLAYNFTPEFIRQPTQVYGAFEFNHLGKNVKYYRRGTHDEKDPTKLKRETAKNQNKAWYVGCLIGEVDKEGDWSVEARYEYVQAFAVPDEDASGICNGNVLGTSITSINGDAGNTNYKGWVFEGLYALTDNITIDTQVEWSNAIDPKINGKHKYSKLEVEAIYAF